MQYSGIWDKIGLYFSADVRYEFSPPSALVASRDGVTYACAVRRLIKEFNTGGVWMS